MNDAQEVNKFSSMRINPLEIREFWDAEKHFGDMESFLPLAEASKEWKSLELLGLIKYVVLLYSDDSTLNQKPRKKLDERQHTAAQIAGIKPGSTGKYGKAVTEKVFLLRDESIFSFVFEYMISQRNHIWTEINVLERQIQENQRLRFTQTDDLRDIEKKDKLTSFFKSWNDRLSDYYDEFFEDHVNVFEEMKRRRLSMATIENFART